VTRYVGTGSGVWAGRYVYTPSLEDRQLATRLANETAERTRKARRRRPGYGDPLEVRASWYDRGILGEIAALHPLGAGPDLEAWAGRGRWRGQADWELIEVRTTSVWELYGFALHPSPRGYVGLGGWRVTAKDTLGRVVVCVDELETGTLRVWGWLSVGEALQHRLDPPLAGILAVIEPDQLHDLLELEPYALAYDRAMQLEPVL